MAEFAQHKDFLKEIEEMRRRVILIKGGAVEGLTPLEEEKALPQNVLLSKEKELNQ